VTFGNYHVKGALRRIYADNQTDRKAERKTNSQSHTETEKLTYKETNKSTAMSMTHVYVTAKSYLRSFSRS